MSKFNQPINFGISLPGLILVSLLLCSGCTSLNYYSQSALGQFNILSLSESIESLLENKTLSPELTAQLQEALQIREFASRVLFLPENNSYRYYADLKREFVVWNVFAAESTSLKAKEWCYLIAGCLGYRGYFSKDEAITFQHSLIEQGLDTWVGGVTAYSTLGWFTDPVLNTMLLRGDDYLAKTIFHELAHQKLYIKDDTALNEAFAETIAIEGVKRWITIHGNSEQLTEFNVRQMQEDEFVHLVLDYREKLENLYDSDLSKEEKLNIKHKIIEQMQHEYQNFKIKWNNDRYDNWFSSNINNAKLLAVSTYRRYLPAMQNKLKLLQGDIRAFYRYINDLENCSADDRRRHLENDTLQVAC